MKIPLFYTPKWKCRLQNGTHLFSALVCSHQSTPQDRQRVRFQQADAQDLPDDLGQFGCILACMLLDRVPDPHRLLSPMKNFLPVGGILVIISPYSLNTEFTGKVGSNFS